MCVLGAQKNRLIETLHLSTHNIGFGCEIRKIVFNYTLLSGGLCPDKVHKPTVSDEMTNSVNRDQTAPHCFIWLVCLNNI